jgi:hypothetical protein
MGVGQLGGSEKVGVCNSPVVRQWLGGSEKVGVCNSPIPVSAIHQFPRPRRFTATGQPNLPRCQASSQVHVTEFGVYQLLRINYRHPLLDAHTLRTPHQRHPANRRHLRMWVSVVFRFPRVVFRDRHFVSSDSRVIAK